MPAPISKLNGERGEISSENRFRSLQIASYLRYNAGSPSHVSASACSSTGWSVNLTAHYHWWGGIRSLTISFFIFSFQLVFVWFWSVGLFWCLKAGGEVLLLSTASSCGGSLCLVKSYLQQYSSFISDTQLRVICKFCKRHLLALLELYQLTKYKQEKQIRVLFQTILYALVS